MSVTTGTPFSVATWVRIPLPRCPCVIYNASVLVYEAPHSPAIRRLPIERQGRALRPQAELPFVCRAPKQLAEATAPLAAAASSLASPFVFRYGLGLSANTRSCGKRKYKIRFHVRSTELVCYMAGSVGKRLECGSFSCGNDMAGRRDHIVADPKVDDVITLQDFQESSSNLN